MRVFVEAAGVLSTSLGVDSALVIFRTSYCQTTQYARTVRLDFPKRNVCKGRQTTKQVQQLCLYLLSS